MKLISKIIIAIISFLTFVLLLSGVLLNFGKELLNRNNVLSYIDNNDLYELKINNITIKETVLEMGIVNGIDDDTLNRIMNDETFKQNMKDLIKSCYQKAIGEETNFNNAKFGNDINNIEGEFNKFDFANGLINYYKSFNNANIYEMYHFNFLDVVFITIGLAVLVGILTLSIRYPFLYLGVSNFIIGLLTLSFTNEILIQITNYILEIDLDYINYVGIFDKKVSTLMMISGLLLIAIFGIMTYLKTKKTEPQH